MPDRVGTVLLFDASKCPPVSTANAIKVKAAETHALEGGQALHVWDPGPDGWPGAPQVFLRNRPWAHLFDQNLERLKKTAKKLGVRVVVVGHQGKIGQHIDLCGGPLKKAIALCEANKPKPKGVKLKR